MPQCGRRCRRIADGAPAARRPADTRRDHVHADDVLPRYYGFYSAWMAYPRRYQYDIATAEVNLFDVKTNKLVWGGTTETFDPKSVTQESAGFANVIINALANADSSPAAVVKIS